MMRAALLLCAGCSFTATKDPLEYEDLSDDQQSAVRRIDENLVAIDQAFLGQGGPGICGDLNPPPLRCSDLRAEVGFEDILLAVNMGDGRARVSFWNDLSSAQRDLTAGWWQVDVAAAETLYPAMAYDYMALHLGALEYIYLVQGVERVFEQRPRLNVERDAGRLVGAYLRTRGTALMDHMMTLCGPMRAQYDAVWADHYGWGREYELYFQDNLRDLADPAHPTGYFYFLCRWTEDARNRSDTLFPEMLRIQCRFQPELPGCP